MAYQSEPRIGECTEHPALIEERRFRSCSGNTKIFEWHALFGNSGRIHFWFDAQTKEVEIGYIGKHLPL